MSDARTCDKCGARSSPYMPRKRVGNELWCGMCAQNQGKNVTTARIAISLNSDRIVRVAHDSGDGETLFHCCFCGSGQIIARSDGTVECEFCNTAFTVQVQPQMPSFPQTIDGQPIDVPGMPNGGKDANVPPGVDPLAGDGEVDPADAANQPFGDDPDAADDGDADQDGGGADDGKPAFLKGSLLYRTASGRGLTEPQMMRRLAILCRTDDAVLDRIRRANQVVQSSKRTAALEVKMAKFGHETHLTWGDIGDRHPHVYGFDDEEGDDAHGGEGWGIGEAAKNLAFSRPEDPDAEGHSHHDLDFFHEAHVDPKHVDYARHGGLNDGRVRHAYEGFKAGHDVPPAVLVHRHGVYQVADGHHRAEAAHLLGIKLPAYVTHSPHPDEPASSYEEGEHKAPYHGAEPIQAHNPHTSVRKSPALKTALEVKMAADKQSDAHLLQFSHDERETGGSQWPTENRISAVHPEHGRVGFLHVLLPRRANGKVKIQRLEVDKDHTRKGYGSALMDHLQESYPKASIDHGDRTNDGQTWWDSYGKGRADKRGRTAASSTGGY